MLRKQEDMLKEQEDMLEEKAMEEEVERALVKARLCRAAENDLEWERRHDFDGENVALVPRECNVAEGPEPPRQESRKEKFILEGFRVDVADSDVRSLVWTPWSGQQLQIRQTTEHLGTVLDDNLSTDSHVAQRIRRACASFYGLTPLGNFTNRLTAADKIFLWKTVVLPALIFGCETAPLSSTDIERLDSRQASLIKAALGLPRSAHHTALLIAAGVPRIDAFT
ncbi:hypothetical protein FJT64_027548 [Amphibalanus amphitrite]|uniref:Uncharacterized protein n=1 Tax=Amphibalanus amphitrite TaxID=1232801 RepID=A0A6A4W3D5_AMPAM|nr:hypothetical protein FJT64_027548 [Amphibalanus amphitrite]